MLRDVDARQGNSNHFDFTPEVGTRSVLDGRQNGSASMSAGYFAAVLRVWIGGGFEVTHPSVPTRAWIEEDFERGTHARRATYRLEA